LFSTHVSPKSAKTEGKLKDVSGQFVCQMITCHVFIRSGAYPPKLQRTMCKVSAIQLSLQELSVDDSLCIFHETKQFLYLVVFTNKSTCTKKIL